MSENKWRKEKTEEKATMEWLKAKVASNEWRVEERSIGVCEGLRGEASSGLEFQFILYDN